MQILSHRGLWTCSHEKNSPEAFHRSFQAGFGTETDLRDSGGELVISHDIPGPECLLFREFLEIFIRYDRQLPLALNIKADGLAEQVKALLADYQIKNYFCFDMSVPDMFGYLNAELTLYTRISEIEPETAVSEQAQGVWLDSFYHDRCDTEKLRELMARGIPVCCVSPELHRKDATHYWQQLRDICEEQPSYSSLLMLCTDNPENAREVFDGK